MSKRGERSRPDPVLLGCLAAVLAPFVVGLVRVVFVHWTPAGDWALLELRTRSVGGSHTPLVGPYSRFGWSHPGPALFMVLSVPYRLLGSRPNGLLFAALLVNGASVAVIVLLAWRRGRRPLTIGTAIGLALLCRALGAVFLRDPWNPYITVLPFAALVFLAWSIACGDAWMVPVALLVASFIVQSHVGYAALVAVVLLTAVVWRLVVLVGHLRHRGAGAADRGTRRRTMAAVGVSALVTVVAWLPPLLDQIAHPGNLQAFWDFFGRRHATPTNDTAFRLVGRALTFPGTWVTGHDAVETVHFTPVVSGFFLPLGLFALAAGAVFALRRRDRDASALLALVLATLVAAVYSVSHIAGPLAAYLVRWLLVIGMLTWLAAAWAFWPLLSTVRAGRAARFGLAGLAIASLVVPTAASVADSVRIRAPWYRVGLVEQHLARDTVARLHTGGRPVLLMSTGDRWFTWGLAPRLEAAGIAVAARQADVLFYGRHRVARRRDARVAVVVVVGADARTSGRPARGTLVAWYPGRREHGVSLSSTPNYRTVVVAAEQGLLASTVAVYEVPL